VAIDHGPQPAHAGRGIGCRFPVGPFRDRPSQDRVPDLDLWRLVQALPNRQRQVVILRYIGDLTEASIADVLGISAGSVSASLTKARATLRAGLMQGGQR
jgi:DNA-directed RNA polymerase specialized sigma24 family protein